MAVLDIRYATLGPVDGYPIWSTRMKAPAVADAAAGTWDSGAKVAMHTSPAVNVIARRITEEG
jgi:hypothetical protein